MENTRLELEEGGGTVNESSLAAELKSTVIHLASDGLCNATPFVHPPMSPYLREINATVTKER